MVDVGGWEVAYTVRQRFRICQRLGCRGCPGEYVGPRSEVVSVLLSKISKRRHNRFLKSCRWIYIQAVVVPVGSRFFQTSKGKVGSGRGNRQCTLFGRRCPSLQRGSCRWGGISCPGRKDVGRLGNNVGNNQRMVYVWQQSRWGRYMRCKVKGRRRRGGYSVGQR